MSEASFTVRLPDVFRRLGLYCQIARFFQKTLLSDCQIFSEDFTARLLDFKSFTVRLPDFFRRLYCQMARSFQKTLLSDCQIFSEGFTARLLDFKSFTVRLPDFFRRFFQKLALLSDCQIFRRLRFTLRFSDFTRIIRQQQPKKSL